MGNLTEKQIEWIKLIHSQYPSQYVIGGHKAKNAMQKEIEETFSEAFTEPMQEKKTIQIVFDAKKYPIVDCYNAGMALRQYFRGIELDLEIREVCEDNDKLYTAEDMTKFATDYMNELDICDSETYLSDWKKSKETN